jgi:hypothetical protein
MNGVSLPGHSVVAGLFRSLVAFRSTDARAQRPLIGFWHLRHRIVRKLVLPHTPAVRVCWRGSPAVLLPGTQVFYRLQACFYSQRRDGLQDLFTESAVDHRATEADAVLPAVIEIAFAQITRVSSGAAPVADMKLTAAMAAAQQPNQEPLSSTDRRHRFISLPVNGVAARHTLIFFLSGPVNIFHMMTSDENPTLLGLPIRCLALLESAVDQQRLRQTSSPNISSSVERIP